MAIDTLAEVQRLCRPVGSTAPGVNHRPFYDGLRCAGKVWQTVRKADDIGFALHWNGGEYYLIDSDGISTLYKTIRQ